MECAMEAAAERGAERNAVGTRPDTHGRKGAAVAWLCGDGEPFGGGLTESPLWTSLDFRGDGASFPERLAAVYSSKGVSPAAVALLRATLPPNSLVDLALHSAPKSQSALRKSLVWICSGFGREAPKDPERLWFTADSHFGHPLLARLRGFGEGEDGVRAMDEALVKAWNARVAPDDEVWHLGDFCFGRDKDSRIPGLVSSLNGRIRLVLGNHDRRPLAFYLGAGFRGAYDVHVLLRPIPGVSLALSHEPLGDAPAGTVGICGHVHAHPAYRTFSQGQCVACVERHSLAPISLAEVLRGVGRAGTEGVQ